MIRNCFEFLALAAAMQLASAAASAQTGDIRYLASPGAAAKAFPRFERPVAEIISPRRSTEEARDANQETQQLARLMGLRPGMVVGDIGAGWVTAPSGWPGGGAIRRRCRPGCAAGLPGRPGQARAAPQADQRRALLPSAIVSFHFTRSQAMPAILRSSSRAERLNRLPLHPVGHKAWQLHHNVATRRCRPRRSSPSRAVIQS